MTPRRGRITHSTAWPSLRRKGSVSCKSKKHLTPNHNASGSYERRFYFLPYFLGPTGVKMGHSKPPPRPQRGRHSWHSFKNVCNATAAANIYHPTRKLTIARQSRDLLRYMLQASAQQTAGPSVAPKVDRYNTAASVPGQLAH